MLSRPATTHRQAHKGISELLQWSDHRVSEAAMTDDLRIAVLGVGMMGGFHVDALSRRVRGARVTVVNDFLADKAADVAGKVGARAEADPIAATNAPEVDAVLIATPAAVRY